MARKDVCRIAYGTKIFNHKTQEIGLLIYSWTNVFADGEVPFAKCVNIDGKSYDTEMDNISAIEDEE